MRAKIRKINGIFPVSITRAIYFEDTNKTLYELIKNGEIIGKINSRDPYRNEIFEVEEIEYYGNIITSTSELEINEGETANINIKLDEPPTSIQLVNIISEESNIIIEPSCLYFDEGNYNINQSISVRIQKDDRDVDYSGDIILSSGVVLDVSVKISIKNVIELTDRLESIKIETETNTIPMSPSTFKITTIPYNFDKSLLTINKSSDDIVIDGDSIYFKSVGLYSVDVSYKNIKEIKDISCVIPSGVSPEAIDFSDLFKSYQFKVGRLYNITTKVNPEGANNSFIVSADPNNIVFSGNTIKFLDTRQTTLTIKSTVDENISNTFIVTPSTVEVSNIKLGTKNNYFPINLNGIATDLFLDPVDSVGDIKIEPIEDTNGILSVLPTISNGKLNISGTNKEGNAKLKLSSKSNPELSIVIDVEAKGFAPHSLNSFAGGQLIYEPNIGYSNGKIYKLDGSLSEINPKLSLLNWEYPEVTIICIGTMELAGFYNNGKVAFTISDRDGFTCKIKQSDGSYLEPKKTIIKERNKTLEPKAHRGGAAVMSVIIKRDERKVRYVNHSYGSIYEYELNTDLDMLEYENQQSILALNKPNELITSRLSFFTSALSDSELNDCVQRITHDLKPSEDSFFYGFDQITRVGDTPINVDSYWVARYPSDKRFMYKSDNEDVLIVDRNGWITAKKPGLAHINTIFKDVVYNTNEIIVKSKDYVSEKIELTGRSIVRVI